MTRINLVHPEDLADQHLFAEWREIKMVPAALRRSLRTRAVNDVLSGISKNYTLNKGHVTFFYNKMKYLRERYNRLTEELKVRQYSISEHNADDIFFKDIPAEFSSRHWLPSSNEIGVSIERIVQKINERPDWYRYCGEIRRPGYFSARYTRY